METRIERARPDDASGRASSAGTESSAARRPPGSSCDDASSLVRTVRSSAAPRSRCIRRRLLAVRRGRAEAQGQGLGHELTDAAIRLAQSRQRAGHLSADDHRRALLSEVRVRAHRANGRAGDGPDLHRIHVRMSVERRRSCASRCRPQEFHADENRDQRLRPHGSARAARRLGTAGSAVRPHQRSRGRPGDGGAPADVRLGARPMGSAASRPSDDQHRDRRNRRRRFPPRAQPGGRALVDAAASTSCSNAAASSERRTRWSRTSQPASRKSSWRRRSNPAR